MAVIRDTGDDNTVSYISTLAFFCCVSCIIVMLKFGRFKTSFNVFDEKKRKSGKGHDGIGNIMSINGAYRTNRDEFFVYSDQTEPQRKLTPSIPVIPPNSKDPKPGQIRQAKSTNDLIKDKNLRSPLREAQSGISLDPRGTDIENGKNKNRVVESKHKQLDAEKRVEKQRIEEQKKLERQRLEAQKKQEKQRLEERKKQEKMAMQERANQEKLKKQQQSKKEKKNKKAAAPQRPLANPLAHSSSQAINKTSAQPSGSKYSTNTLESSISKTSGPPPYSEDPHPERSQNENNGNVTFSKPVETDSWDMISQHRHNVCIRKPANTAPPTKLTTLDLNFNLGEPTNKDNSEV